MVFRVSKSMLGNLHAKVKVTAKNWGTAIILYNLNLLAMKESLWRVSLIVEIVWTFIHPYRPYTQISLGFSNG
jgi:hypothetical protein